MRPKLRCKRGYWYFKCRTCKTWGLPHYSSSGAYVEHQHHVCRELASR